MKKFITTEQIKEIEQLAPKHFDALVNYGADMYSDGIIKGSIYTCIGLGAAIGIVKLATHIYKR